MPRARERGIVAALAASTSHDATVAIAPNDAAASSSKYDELDRLLSQEPRPRLVAFDLDYTLWPVWVDTHVDTPIKRKGNAINKVVDRHGQSLSFFDDVPAILIALHHHRIPIAAASRTSAPSAARQALNGLVLADDYPRPYPTSNSSSPTDADPPPPSSPSSSSPRTSPPPRPTGPRRTNGAAAPAGATAAARTFKSTSLFDYLEIYPGSKIQHFRCLQRDSSVDFRDMIFFDDEYRNSEVDAKLGVHFVDVGSQGLDLATFVQGVEAWRERRKRGESLANGQD